MTSAYIYGFFERLGIIAGFGALIFGVVLMLAFTRAMRHSEGATWHFAQATRWITTAYVYRTLYWDVIRYLVPRDIWQDWSALSGGLSVNIVWSVAFIMGCYHGLRALHLTIPDEERREWPWWAAWAYPPSQAVVAFRRVQSVIRANARLRGRRSRPPE